MNSLEKVAIALICGSSVAAFFTGCGGGGGGGGSGSSESAEESSKAITFDLFGNGANGTFEIGQSLVGSIPLQYEITSISANQCEGTASFSPTSFSLTQNNPKQKITFVFTTNKQCITNKLTVSYNRLVDLNSTDSIPPAKFSESMELLNPAYSSSRVSILQNNDPLYQHQWHLKNTGQSIGVTKPAVAGNDINVEGAWSVGTTGKGVTVAVIDEGVDMFHPDLASNINFDLSYNYHTASSNPTPIRTIWAPDMGGYYDFPHGTAVAGLIGAKGWNGIGARGVAPDTNIVSYNALEVLADEANALYMAHEIPYQLTNAELQLHRMHDSLIRNIDKIDVYNNSWGDNVIDLGGDYPTYLGFDNQLRYGAVNGRDQKGSIYVKAAGNSRVACDKEGVVSCDMDNFESLQNNGYFIVAGAVGADGKYSYYSTPGSNILVSAPGGDANPYYLGVDEQMIVTTDLCGSERGYDANIPKETLTPHFNVFGNENYDYTQRMNGTSAAAPIISGIAALMLEANSNLSYRDAQIILARTAIKNDENSTGWKINAAGLHFNNDYGFGMADATAAVTIAKTFGSVGGYWAQKSFDGENENDVASNLSGVATSSINILDQLSIEHASIYLSIKEGDQTYLGYSYNGGSGQYSGGIGQTQFIEPIYLNAGTNTFTVTNNDDSNGTISLYIADYPSHAVATPLLQNFIGQNTTSVSHNISNSGNYSLLVDGNSSSWNIAVSSPIPKAKTPNLKISLISPSKTQSVLVDAPNGLADSEEYNATRLSTVQFMDENASGTWELKVEDTNGGSFVIDGWSLNVRGH